MGSPLSRADIILKINISIIQMNLCSKENLYKHLQIQGNEKHYKIVTQIYHGVTQMNF